MTRKQLIPDYSEAERFLKLISTYDELSSGEEPSFTFQTFDDAPAKDKSLIKTLHGHFSELKGTLEDFNNKGAGVFVTINRTDLIARKEENILSTRAYFIDSDNGPINSYFLKPNLIVTTKSGEHAYWITSSNDDPILFRPMQKRLISVFNTDRKICDPSRVMRLPGFYHLKDLNQPFLIKIKDVSDTKYGHEEIYMGLMNTLESQDDKLK